MGMIVHMRHVVVPDTQLPSKPAPARCAVTQHPACAAPSSSQQHNQYALWAASSLQSSSDPYSNMLRRFCPLLINPSCPCSSTSPLQPSTLNPHPPRADGKGTSYELPWTRGWAGVSDGFTETTSPITEFGVYKMKPYGKKEGCAAWACDQFKGMFVYSFKWKLPAGFKCEQCKLQHYYLTASRCWPQCQGGSCHKKPVIYADCGAPGATYPEE